MSDTTASQLFLYKNSRNYWCAKLGDYQVHSAFDPIKEAEKAAANKELSRADCVIFFGYGLGYTVNEISRIHTDLKLLILEPSLENMKKALEVLPEYLPPKARIETLISENQMVSSLQDLAVRSPLFLVNPAVKHCFPEAFQEASRGLEKFKQRSKVNSNTLIRFGRLWIKNFLRNKDALLHFQPLQNYEGLFEGIPGLVLAAGPGLDEVLPHLEEIRERCVLVAVDTSLRVFRGKNFQADFIVSVDPQYWNSRHLDWPAFSRGRLVSETSIYPQSLRRFKQAPLFASSIFPLAKWFEKELDLSLGKLGAGGSVATSAWDLLRLLNCNQSWIAGLDLAYPDNATHFKGALFEEASHLNAQRFLPAEQQRFEYRYNGLDYLCEASNGESIPSDHRMDIYVQWFENYQEQHAERYSRRLGSNNRKIKGLESASIKEILELAPCREEIDARLAGIEAKTCSFSKKILEEKEEKLIHVLEDLFTTSRQALEIIEELEHTTIPQDYTRLLKSLDLLDQKLINDPDSRLPGFLMETQIQKVFEKASSEENPLSQSKMIYSSFLEECEFHLRLLNYYC